jgi:hypothetical protein
MQEMTVGTLNHNTSSQAPVPDASVKYLDRFVGS